MSAYSSTRREPGSWLDRQFKIADRRSTVSTEIVAGLATFLTMCYILFVNAGIMSSVKDHAGHSLPFVQVLTVTALVAGLATILMGLWANQPFALATGLGLNAFVAFTLVGSVGLTWPEACGVIVMEGVLITLAVLTGLRRLILDAIPLWLKQSIGIGIGLFIALIGLVNAGVVVKGQGTLVTIVPEYRTWPLLIFAVGLVVTAALEAFEIKGSLLFGIIFTTVFATIVNSFKDHRVFTDGSAKLPDHWWTSPDFGLVGNFNFDIWSTLSAGTAAAIILSVMLSDFFDTAGTVTGIAARGGMLDKDGNLPNMNRVLLVDSLAAAGGGLSGNSSNTTFIESQAGVDEGGRTGLTSVVVGLLFLASLALASVAGMVPAVATAPVLVIIGVKMFGLVSKIDWDDLAIAIPAFATIVMMPFTYSITNGVGAGFILYTVVSVLTGRAKQVHPLMYIVSAVFAWYFWHGVIG